MWIPRFLTLPLWGLDISDRSYKYVELLPVYAHMKLGRFGEGAIPAGTVENGEIKNPDLLSDTLKPVVQSLGMRTVALSLPEEKGFLRSIKLPLANLKRSEIANTLRAQIEQHVPLPATETVFDYIVAGEEKDHYDVVLRAFPRALVESYCYALERLGVMPTTIEPELAAMVRALVPHNFVEPAMLIDWGLTRTSFAIFERGVVRFAITLPLGGAMLTDAIAKQLKVDTKEAERIKYEKAFVALDQAAMSSNEITQAMVPMISALRQEAAKYLAYWRARGEGVAPIRTIFLSGGEVHLKGLREHLSQELGVAVQFANPWENISFPSHYVPLLSRHDSLLFTAAIGLSLKSFEEHKIL